MWDPFRQKDIDKLEKIQRSAARFVTQNYRQTASVTSLIQNLGWTDLKTRRKNSRLVSMFKILNELVEIPINDRLIPADRRTRGGHNQAYKHLSLWAEWQSTHPPYQLIPHTNSTPVHTWVDQLILSPPTAITNSSPRPSIPYQLIPSHRPSVTNSSPTHDYIVGYLNCFKVRHTDSQRLLILWECNKTHLLLEAIYFI